MIPKTVRHYGVEIRPIKDISPSFLYSTSLSLLQYLPFFFFSLPILKPRETLHPVLPRAALAYTHHTQQLYTIISLLIEPPFILTSFPVWGPYMVTLFEPKRLILSL